MLEFKGNVVFTAKSFSEILVFHGVENVFGKVLPFGFNEKLSK